MGRPHHRKQHAHVGLARELRDGGELRAERARVRQKQLHAAPRLGAQERRQLVAAEVEHPHGGRAAGEAGEQRSEHLHVLFA